jgi:hypothetical protein
MCQPPAVRGQGENLPDLVWPPAVFVARSGTSARSRSPHGPQMNAMPRVADLPQPTPGRRSLLRRGRALNPCEASALVGRQCQHFATQLVERRYGIDNRCRHFRRGRAGWLIAGGRLQQHRAPDAVERDLASIEQIDRKAGRRRRLSMQKGTKACDLRTERGKASSIFQRTAPPSASVLVNRLAGSTSPASLPAIRSAILTAFAWPGDGAAGTGDPAAADAVSCWASEGAAQSNIIKLHASLTQTSLRVLPNHATSPEAIGRTSSSTAVRPCIS